MVHKRHGTSLKVSSHHLLKIPRSKLDFIENEKNILNDLYNVENLDASQEGEELNFDYKNPSPLMRQGTSKKYEHIPIDEWLEKRDDMVEEANKDCFSNDIHLNDRELKAEKILFKLRT